MQNLQSPHSLSVVDVVVALETDALEGLAVAEAADRAHVHGTNELPPEKRTSIAAKLFAQFNKGLTYVLLAAAALSLATGEHADVYAILIAVGVNVAFGYIQERRAESALDALKKMVVREASVVRGGKVYRVAASTLVPGDLVRLEEGDRVPADARIVECKDMRTDESALTGESSTVRKSVDAVAETAPRGDRASMVWMGTNVTTGRGVAVVTAIGPRTAFGSIATSLATIRRTRTPLETRLDGLGRALAFLAFALAGAAIIGGMARGFPFAEIFFFAVALVVSVVPEGLPAVLAVVLAIGVQRMARRKAIVRHVPSVETLGAADTICTDKTGTLTENKMTVRAIATAGMRVTVSGEGWETEGEFRVGDRVIRPSETPELARLLVSAALCNRASIEIRDDRAIAVGDPTEAALVVLGSKAGVHKADLSQEYEIIDEVPFSSQRKFRAMLVERTSIEGKKERLAFLVGAFEAISPRCATALHEGVLAPFDELRVTFIAENETMAGRALRVLAVAAMDAPSLDSLTENDLDGMTMLGIVGMIDPPRAGVKRAIEKCQRAGVRVIMLTGDQRATAYAVAKDVGIVNGGGPQGVYTETDVAGMDDAAFRAAVADAAIFARVAPETKLRIVTALQESGHTVAMTGDGVNDAPALKKASIGIAMGVTGTDVSREVADMVLADDNFVTIVNAMEEGRIVFRNVQQTTAYLFMTNIGEALTVLVAIFVGMPLPLLPAQILWLNLVTDGFPGIALPTEPSADGVLDEPPRKRNAAILTRGVLLLSALTAAVMGVGTIVLFAQALDGGEEYARTVAFTAMAFFQLWNVLNLRSLSRSIVSLRPFSNMYVNGAIAASVGLHLAVLYVPALQETFRTVPLGAGDMLRIAAVAFSTVPIVEAFKWSVRRGYVSLQ